jgi:hypothetical protein
VRCGSREGEAVWEIFRSFNLAGRIGMVVGLLGALAGAAAAIVAAPVGGTILVVVLLGMIITAFWFAWRPQLQRNRLVKQGVAGWATILSIQETGWTVQGNYGQAKLRLSVEPPDGSPPYEVETRALINRFDIPQYQPGTRLQVAIDPRDPQAVAIV